MRKLFLASMATFLLAAPVVAQAPPTAQNIIPDAISYATQGKISALDPGAETLTITPENQPPIQMAVAPGVNLGDLQDGDVASVHYTRTVTFTIGNAPTTATGNTTVAQAAQNPIDIRTSTAPITIIGRVVKINGPNSVDVVNNNGGGIYTIKTTQPSRMAAIAKLKVGELGHRPRVPDHRHFTRQVRPIRHGTVRLLNLRNLANYSLGGFQGKAYLVGLFRCPAFTVTSCATRRVVGLRGNSA